MESETIGAAGYFSGVDSRTEGMPTPDDCWRARPLPGNTMQERRLCLEVHLDDRRQPLMREPRGHSAMSGAFLQPAIRSGGGLGVLFVEVSGLLPMCGRGAFAVATVLVEPGSSR